MKFKIDKTIQENNLNFFFVLSFFFIYLIFILSKGYIRNEEFSDIVFLTLSVIAIELVYLIVSNQFFKVNFNNLKNNFLFFSFFSILLLVWNYETILNYKDILFFLIFHLCLTIPIINLTYQKNFNIIKNNKIIYCVPILSLFLSGLFYNISYSSFNFYIVVLIICLFTIGLNIFLNKLNRSTKWIDIFLSFFFFFIILKTFLLSSIKDPFHYSWILGPANSLNQYHTLLDNVPSQYGFLNVLLISKLSKFIGVDSTNIIVGLIIIFFIFFFIIFFKKILKLINLPYTILTIFLGFLIFGNIGYADLSGSMFIPSSSVFRFLPSLITIIFFSKLLNYNRNYSTILFFYFSLFISLLWSVESGVFVIFAIFSVLLLKLLLSIPQFINKKNYVYDFSKYKFILVLGLILSIILYLFISEKNFFLFYEHAFNSNAALNSEIVNNKLTLVYLYFLLLGYLILRDSFIIKKKFYNNVLWFALFVSYSTYFLVRSVDNNLINILPFIIFCICSMDINSKQIISLRRISLVVIILFSITSTMLSITINKSKFYNNFSSLNFLNTPKYLNSNYQPNKEILKSINKYPSVPLTLISGKTIHQPNKKLPTDGYGLPILPLEHFNVLNFQTKKLLMDNYFKKNQKHLILCTYDCGFYYSDAASNIFEKIFLIETLKVEKIEINKSDEYLYLLTKF